MNYKNALLIMLYVLQLTGGLKAEPTNNKVVADAMNTTLPEATGTAAAKIIADAIIEVAKIKAESRILAAKIEAGEKIAAAEHYGREAVKLWAPIIGGVFLIALFKLFPVS